MKKLVMTIALASMVPFSTAVLADEYGKDERKHYEEQLRENKKHRDEQERESRKFQEEQDREYRKHQEEIAREERKDWEEAETGTYAEKWESVSEAGKSLAGAVWGITKHAGKDVAEKGKKAFTATKDLLSRGSIEDTPKDGMPI